MLDYSGDEIDDGGNAFPSLLPGGHYQTTGMSLLDWFAGQALGPLAAACEAEENNFISPSDVAASAYEYAAQMIKERNYIHKFNQSRRESGESK